MGTQETLKTIARKWYRFRRLLIYANVAQSVMITALFFDRYGWQWFVIALIPGLMIAWALHLFDSVQGLPVESEIALRDNAEWIEMKRMIADMHDVLIGE